MKELREVVIEKQELNKNRRRRILLLEISDIITFLNIALWTYIDVLYKD